MKKLFYVFTSLVIVLTSNLLLAQSNWTLQTNPMGYVDSTEIGKIQFVSSTEGWISSGKGDLLHTTDAGVNWMVVTPFPNDTVLNSSDPAVSMSWVNQTHGWEINSIGPEYGISNGVVIHQTTDGGNNWQKKVLSTVQGDFGFKIQFVDINNGWLLIFNFSTQIATFLKTTDGGNNWVPFNGSGIFYFVDANNGWSYYGSGLNGTEPPYKILRTTNGGIDWTEQFVDSTAGGYNAIQFTNVNNGWVVGDAGKVLKTTDGGTNWNFVTNSGINPNDRSKAVFFIDANNWWISTKNELDYGTVQHTTDGGTSWTTQETPLQNPHGGNSIFSIYFVDAQNGWLTASNGKICHYTGTTGVEENNNITTEFLLTQNYPNPFNPSTTIEFTLPKTEYVELKVYNIVGKEVSTLVSNKLNRGNHTYTFDGKNLASGVYYYQLLAGDYREVKKMILLR